MKFWKKTACLALSATMSFGVFAACGETGDNGNSEQKRREQARASAKNYVDTVADTLESAKSFNVSGKIVLNSKVERFGEDGKMPVLNPALRPFAKVCRIGSAFSL